MAAKPGAKPSVGDLTAAIQVEQAKQSGKVLDSAGQWVQAKQLVGKAVMCPDCATSATPQTAELVEVEGGTGWACRSCGSTGLPEQLLGNPNAVLRAGGAENYDSGMPWIVRPDGKVARYSRASSFTKPLEDTFMLHRRDQRSQAIGTLRAPQLVLETERAVQRETLIDDADSEAKKQLDILVNLAMREGGSWVKADRGTLFHTVVEHLDLGRPVPAGLVSDHLRDVFLAALAERTKVLAELDYVCLAREVFVVHDGLEAAGALDSLAIVTLPDHDTVPEHLRGVRVVVVADDKTSNELSYAGMAYSAQQAIYVDGLVYNPGTGQRVKLDHYVAELLRARGIDPGDGTPRLTSEVALILHAPLDHDDASFHAVVVPLDKGRAAAEHNVVTRAMRSESPKWLAAPALSSSSPRAVEAPAQVMPTIPTQAERTPLPSTGDPISDRIRDAASYDDLRRLYLELEPTGAWTPLHTELAGARKALLQAEVAA